MQDATARASLKSVAFNTALCGFGAEEFRESVVRVTSKVVPFKEDDDGSYSFWQLSMASAVSAAIATVKSDQEIVDAEAKCRSLSSCSIIRNLGDIFGTYIVLTGFQHHGYNMVLIFVAPAAVSRSYDLVQIFNYDGASGLLLRWFTSQY